MPPIPIFGTEANVPKTLSSLHLSAIRTSESEQLGTILSYDDRSSICADCILYALGESNPLIALGSPSMEDEMSLCIEQALKMQQMRGCQDSKVILIEPISTHDCDDKDSWFLAIIRCVSAQNAQSRDGHILSFIALRVCHSVIHKIRFTYPECLGDGAFFDFLLFLDEWRMHVDRILGEGAAGSYFRNKLECIKGARRAFAKYYVATFLQSSRDGWSETVTANAFHNEETFPIGVESAASVMHLIMHEFSHNIYYEIEKELILPIDLVNFPTYIDLSDDESGREESFIADRINQVLPKEKKLWRTDS